jgi:hypothetical protein
MARGESRPFSPSKDGCAARNEFATRYSQYVIRFQSSMITEKGGVMPETDRPSASSLRRSSEQRANDLRVKGPEHSEESARRALEAARALSPAARLEERSYALFEILQDELEVLERRDKPNRPSLAPDESAVRPLDASYWQLRLVAPPPSETVRSPAPTLCIDEADWIYVATSLWEAADALPADANLIPPLRRYVATQVRDSLGRTPPKTRDDAVRALRAINAYITDGGFPSLAEVDATPEADPLLAELLASSPARHPDQAKRKWVKAVARLKAGGAERGDLPPRKALKDEPQHIRRLVVEAALAGRVFPIHDRRLIEITQQMHERNLTGLCFSGGGIRSATFGLGLLQSLTREGFLKRFDYLSTVSGGGYIGAWLSAWIRHEGRDTVETKMGDRSVDPTDPEAAPIAHLRAYSNYLSPRVGMFSADTWTLIATYLRNLLLMWLILIPLLASAVMIPRIALSVTRLSALSGWEWLVLLPIALIGLGLGAMAVKFVHGNRPERDRFGALGSISPAAKRDQRAFIKKCLIPFNLSTVLLTSVWAWFYRSEALTPDLSWRFAGLFVLAGALVHWTGWIFGRRRESEKAEGFTLIFTGAVAGGIAYLVTTVLPAVDGTRQDAEVYTTFASPILLLVVMLMNQLYIGFMSRDWRKTDDAEREWAARFNAWLLISALGWAAWSSLVLLAPLLLDRISWESLAATTGISGLLTAQLGNSSQTGPRAAGAKGVEKAKTILAGAGLSLAAPLFVVSFLLLISWVDALAIAKLSVWRDDQLGMSAIQLARLGTLRVTGGLGVLLFFGAIFIARFIDSNKFSLHAMYRMRLIRAYLGASRRPRERAPDPFTGFDENDNMPMRDLQPPSGKPDRPFHIVNVALNLTSSTRLNWQERKAESFTISPLHAGSAQLGYRRTAYGPAQLELLRAIEQVRDCHGAAETTSTTKCLVDAERLAPRIYGGRDGISLGTAITISGAAASPNMGYHSSPAITFLMTLFNARLGWWLGNPGPSGKETFALASPRQPVRPIIDELFSHTDDRRPYVYLSDGGHFENLGLYEMVRRRCRLIVVSDAGCDPTCKLEDIGNAIRKVRVDLGVPIQFGPAFNIKERSKKGEPVDGAYWAVGRIGYSEIDAPRDMTPEEKSDRYDGLLFYVKPAFYGGEPRDVFNYALGHDEFPHEPTSDQWFSESQFESYRSLGEYIGAKLSESGDFRESFRLATMPLTEPQRATSGAETVAIADVQPSEQLRAL